MLYLKYIPKSIRSYLLKFAGFLSIPGVKHASEFYYWYNQLNNDGGVFRNDWYRNLMLAMAGETDDSFLRGKVVADFGCGPCGSLCWATAAKDRIGIDVLVEKYRLLNIDSQPMRYVQSTETAIPLSDESVDILFTVNAMDHVDHFDVMCAELRRILKPEGELIGSFNLDEDASVCEPQTLTEAKINQALLKDVEVVGYRMAKPGPRGDLYRHFRDGSPQAAEGPRFLWVRARKIR